MSRFSWEIARQLARDAFRYRVKDYASPEEQIIAEERADTERSAPLVGNEHKLLDALRAAEKIYDEWLDEFLCLQNVRKLNATFSSDCQKLATDLERALLCWEQMENNQLELAGRAPTNKKNRFDVSTNS